MLGVCLGVIAVSGLPESADECEGINVVIVMVVQSVLMCVLKNYLSRLMFALCFIVSVVVWL